MADTHETITDIIAEARDEYTVHNCNECEYRKSCDLNAYGFDSDKCREMRQSIMLVFGIEDGYFTKLLDRLEAAHRRERGDSAAMRKALMKVRKLFDGRIMFQPAIREAHEAVNAALAAPPRNCDVMDWRTAWKIWREKFHPETPAGYSAVVKGTEAFMDWFTDPATEQEGGANG